MQRKAEEEVIAVSMADDEADIAQTNRKPGRCGSAGLPRVGILGGRVPPAPVRFI
jgi:hypothetical protein